MLETKTVETGDSCSKCKAEMTAKGTSYDGLCDVCGWDEASGTYSK